MKSIRVFISSPGDVQAEREKAKWVVDRLDRHYQDRADLQPLIWEDFGLDAGKSFQEGIDTILSTAGGVDIAVFILWSRFGSELADDIKKDDGTPFRSGTEREFYFMLKAYEESGGSRPQILAYYRQDNSAFHDSLKGKAPDEIKLAIDQFDLAKNFIQTEFHDELGHSTRAYHTYDEPITFANQLTTHLRNIVDRLLGNESASGTWTESPYQGLDAFEVQHADIFHGRDQQIFELETLLRRRQRKGDPAFVAILGASGSGKSSLARAGLAAKLTRFNLDDSVKEWRFACLLPSLGRKDLNLALAECLRSKDALPELNREEISAFIVELADHPQKLARVGLEQASKQVGGRVNLLLLIDQFEELFNVEGISSDARHQFLEHVRAMALDGRIWVVATLRSDFYGAAQKEPLFLDLKRDDGGFDLLPPGPAEIRRIIQEPARMAGVRFEINPDTHRSVADELLREATEGEGIPLPLLQDALRELYEQRGGNGAITYRVYESLGGICGALAKRTTKIVDALPDEQRKSLPSLFRDLVTVDADTGKVARLRVHKGQVANNITRAALVETLSARNARLLTSAGDDHSATISLAHETLIFAWPELNVWIEGNRKGLLDRAETERFYIRWIRGGRQSSLLLPLGAPLQAALSLREGFPHLLDEKQELSRYIRNSQRHHQLRKNLARTAIAMSVLAAAGLLWQFQREQRLRADKQEAELRSQSLSLARKIQARLENGQLQDALAVAEASQRYHPTFETRSATIKSLSRLSPHLIESLPVSPETGVSAVAWCPDNRHVACGDLDGALSVWDTIEPKRIATIEKPIDAEEKIVAVKAIHWASATHLFLVREDGVFFEFSPFEPGGAVRSQSFAPNVRAAAFSPDGENFVSGEATEPRIAIRTTNEPMQPVGAVLARRASAVTVGLGGRIVVATQDNEIYEYVGSKWVSIPLSQHLPLVSLALHSKTGWLSAGASSGGIELLSADFRSGSRLLPNAETVSGLAWHPEQPWLAGTASDGKVHMWKLEDDWHASNQRSPWQDLVGHEDASLCVAWSPDGRKLASGSNDGTVKIWSPFQKQVEFARLKAPRGTALRAGSVSHDGAFVAAAEEDGAVSVWSLATHDLAGPSIRLGSSPVQALAWHPTENLLAAGDENGLIFLSSWPEGKILAQLPQHSNRIWKLRWLADGNTLVSSSWDHKLGLCSKALVRTALWEGHGDFVQGLAVSPDGRSVAAGATDGSIWIWDIASGKPVRVLRDRDRNETEEDNAVGGLAFSPDGKLLASAANDGVVKILDFASGELIQTCLGHEGAVEEVGFSPDGSLLASVGDDHHLWIWQVGQLEPFCDYAAHEDIVWDLCWLPGDKQIVVTTSQDGTLSFLPCSTTWWVERLKAASHRKSTKQQGYAFP